MRRYWTNSAIDHFNIGLKGSYTKLNGDFDSVAMKEDFEILISYYNDVLLTGRVATPNNKLMTTPLSMPLQDSPFINKELFPNETDVAVVSVSNSARLLKRKLSSDDNGIDII